MFLFNLFPVKPAEKMFILAEKANNKNNTDKKIKKQVKKDLKLYYENIENRAREGKRSYTIYIADHDTRYVEMFLNQLIEDGFEYTCETKDIIKDYSSTKKFPVRVFDWNYKVEVMW